MSHMKVELELIVHNEMLIVDNSIVPPTNNSNAHINPQPYIIYGHFLVHN
jgi:hypothetical protein